MTSWIIFDAHKRVMAHSQRNESALDTFPVEGAMPSKAEGWEIFVFGGTNIGFSVVWRFVDAETGNSASYVVALVLQRDALHVASARETLRVFSGDLFTFLMKGQEMIDEKHAVSGQIEAAELQAVAEYLDGWYDMCIGFLLRSMNAFVGKFASLEEKQKALNRFGVVLQCLFCNKGHVVPIPEGLSRTEFERFCEFMRIVPKEGEDAEETELIDLDAEKADSQCFSWAEQLYAMGKSDISEFRQTLERMKYYVFAEAESVKQAMADGMQFSHHVMYSVLTKLRYSPIRAVLRGLALSDNEASDFLRSALEPKHDSYPLSTQSTLF